MNFKIFKQAAFYFCFGILCIAGLIFFYNLSVLPLRFFDESRNAVNAFEMWQNGKYFIKYYQGKPDFYELKPPLLIWTQIVFCQIFGFNEIGIRFISSLAGLFLVYLVFVYVNQYFKSVLMASVSAIILSLSFGFTAHHIVRYGDHDALLVLFSFATFFSFIAYINTYKIKYAIFFVICIFLSVFTKSIMGVIIVVPLVLYLIFTRQLFLFLKFKIILCSISCLFLLVLYYWYHNVITPGYFNEVWNNEWLKRYTNSSYNYKFNIEPWYYYLRNFYKERFSPWIIFIPISFIFNLFDKIKTMFLIHIIIVFLILVISFGTKNFWYDALLYPFLSISVGYFFYTIYTFLNQKSKQVSYAFSIGLALMFLFLSAFKIQNISKIEEEYHLWKQNAIHKYLSQINLNKQTIKHRNIILYEGEDNTMYFYTSVLNHKGHHFRYYKSLDNKALKEIQNNNDTILASQDNLIFALRNSHFKAVDSINFVYKFVK